MLKENEVVMLILGVAVMFLLLVNLEHIRKIRSWKLLTTGFCFLLSGWVFTVSEGIFLGEFLNFCEHISYLISAIFMFFWIWKFTSKIRKEGPA